ncbi:MAG: hypothetical protein KA956_06470 [Pyrinomonadaceae bacterium]|nr:hypothetical protein [Acidobacteriota bacterium]MBP7376103.1 hypothetical protein [Pyrinomonadaceae bacterium]
MKLQAEIDGEKHEVEIGRDGRLVTATVDGREYKLDVSEPEKEVLLVKNANKVSQVFVSPKAGSVSEFGVTIHGQALDVEIIDPKRLRGAGDDHDSIDGLAEIKTAMPGKVVRILVELGADVEKGDGIIVVEAMKMQNELKSPKDGTVKEIRAAEGQTVNAGEVLVVIE